MCYEMVKINELNEMLSEQKISLRTFFFTTMEIISRTLAKASMTCKKKNGLLTKCPQLKVVMTKLNES